MSRGVRARDRQRHRERAHVLLEDVDVDYLLHELIRRSGIRSGYIHFEIRNGSFLHLSRGERFQADELPTGTGRNTGRGGE
jgi:hypothetical protein